MATCMCGCCKIIKIILPQPPHLLYCIYGIVMIVFFSTDYRPIFERSWSGMRYCNFQYTYHCFFLENKYVLIYINLSHLSHLFVFPYYWSEVQDHVKLTTRIARSNETRSETSDQESMRKGRTFGRNLGI